jgi:hypothetical protein
MTQQYMGLGDPTADERAIERELDGKLRDRLKALQEREAELTDELGERPLPSAEERLEVFRGLEARAAFRAAFEEDI